MTDVLVTLIQQPMPVMPPDKKPFAVSTSLVQKLRSHFESDSKPSNTASVLVPYWHYLLLIDLKSNGNITLLDKIDFSKFIQLFVDKSAFIIENRFQV